jgi:hypothetical protein
VPLSEIPGNALAFTNTVLNCNKQFDSILRLSGLCAVFWTKIEKQLLIRRKKELRQQLKATVEQRDVIKLFIMVLYQQVSVSGNCLVNSVDCFSSIF